MENPSHCDSAQALVLLLTYCVNLSLSLNLSEPQFPQLC